jgi:hypothetical protein
MEKKILDALQITHEMLERTATQYHFKSTDIINCLVNYRYRTWVIYNPKLTIIISALEEHVHHIFKDRLISIPNKEMSFPEFCSSLRSGIIHRQLSYFVSETKSGDLFDEYMCWLEKIVKNIQKRIIKIHNTLKKWNSSLPIAQAAYHYAQINLDMIEEFLAAIGDPESMDEIIQKGKSHAWFSPPQEIIDDNEKYFNWWCEK